MENLEEKSEQMSQIIVQESLIAYKIASLSCCMLSVILYLWGDLPNSRNVLCIENFQDLVRAVMSEF